MERFKCGRQRRECTKKILPERYSDKRNRYKTTWKFRINFKMEETLRKKNKGNESPDQ